jgi:pyridoxal phosphate enzyme (YggS family)
MPAAAVPQDIRTRVALVRGRIADACARARRDPSQVRLIAVTKEQVPSVLSILRETGIQDFGENRLDHLEMMRRAAPADARFHAIGRIQGRQLATLAQQCVALHSLCDVDHIQRLERCCALQGTRMAVFLQVNAAEDLNKAGMSVAELPARLDLARAQPHLDVVGLMTMAQLVTDPAGQSQARQAFAVLRQLAERHGLTRLSMGMSADYEIAIEEGATDIRVGHSLFS